VDDCSNSEADSQNDATLNALLPYRGEGGASAVKPLDDAQIKKIDEDWIRWKKEWETRRKVYKE
jgi:26S proteasome regulatory subunit (ATPase 3-interacting protein)